jgi:hypothetical protein
MSAITPTAAASVWTRRAIVPIVALLLVGVLIVAIVASRRPQAALTFTAPETTGKGRSSSDLTLALDALRKLAEGSDLQTHQRVIFYLNQWISSLDPAPPAWKEDRLVEALPRALRSAPGLERLAKLQFSLEDIEYLQQTLWLHDIAERARREPPPEDLKPWLKEIESSVGLPESEQLATAQRLFDWTVRNIQLDPLPPAPKGIAATAGAAKDEPMVPALQGESGPGYSQTPLEMLLYGHGDAHERTRIFILLCRQVGIDAVMLGFEERDSPVPRGWTPAILVGGQLYLFDTGLGLPIPGEGGKGIATLDQLAARPDLLRQLDVDGVSPYPVTENDLKSLVALIDADPNAVSRRMQLLQAALPSGSRLALAAAPRQIELKLQTSKPIKETKLWRVPFEALLYKIGFGEKLQRDPQVAQAFSRQRAVFAPVRPLAKARNLHLQGRFENVEKDPGARALYMQCRPPDRELAKLKTSEYYRKMMGLEGALPEDPAQREAYLDHFLTIATEGKFHASYWLALTYYDEAKYDTAIEWLSKRTVEAVPPSPWTPGARYNLARCYEQLGDFETARQWLLSDKDSPQRHGNLLRAQRLASK